MTARLRFRRYSGLQALGAFNVSYLIPDRDKDGYGLSPQLVDRAAAAGAELIITVDNGISSVAAVEHAKTLGIEAVVTDHHLPGDEIPDTLVVNPNQRGDTFPSKSLAGVGVIFYVLIAVRSALRAKGAYPNGKQPNLQHLIDLVALGTGCRRCPVRPQQPNPRFQRLGQHSRRQNAARRERPALRSRQECASHQCQ